MMVARQLSHIFQETCNLQYVKNQHVKCLLLLSFQLKYSPGSLELKLNAELAVLESVSDSLLQLNNVEGARAISTAQQETADLVHVLKV